MGRHRAIEGENMKVVREVLERRVGDSQHQCRRPSQPAEEEDPKDPIWKRTRGSLPQDVNLPIATTSYATGKPSRRAQVGAINDLGRLAAEG